MDEVLEHARQIARDYRHATTNEKDTEILVLSEERLVIRGLVERVGLTLDPHGPNMLHYEVLAEGKYFGVVAIVKDPHSMYYVADYPEPLLVSARRIGDRWVMDKGVVTAIYRACVAYHRDKKTNDRLP